MNREIKFRAWDGDKTLGYKVNGYQMRKAAWHPNANKRGYVEEHRLIIERKLGRYLIPRKELVHHLNEIRDDNREDNLKLSNPSDHAKGHIGSRNKNGTFVCISKEFQELKYRLYDRDRNLTQIYTLNELISKTFRKGKFEFRGRYIGLKDNNDKEIYEGDIVDYDFDSVIFVENGYDVIFQDGAFLINKPNFKPLLSDCNRIIVVGNIYETPELIK